VTVTIEDEPKVIGGTLERANYEAAAYIAANREALLEHWNGAIDTVELTQRLKSIG